MLRGEDATGGRIVPPHRHIRCRCALSGRPRIQVASFVGEERGKLPGESDSFPFGSVRDRRSRVAGSGPRQRGRSRPTPKTRLHTCGDPRTISANPEADCGKSGSGWWCRCDAGGKSVGACAPIFQNACLMRMTGVPSNPATHYIHWRGQVSPRWGRQRPDAWRRLGLGARTSASA